MKLQLWIGLTIGGFIYHGLRVCFGRSFDWSELWSSIYWTGFAFLVLFAAEKYTA